MSNLESSRVLIANITWNKDGWRNLYRNAHAGHKYAQDYVGHEALNFKFDKVGLDTAENVYGFVQWTNAPKKLEEGALVFFYSKNLDNNKGEIVGVYGNAKIIDPQIKTYWEGFQDNLLCSDIMAEKKYSMLFPIPLNADKYKSEAINRLVGQVGYTYKDISFAEEIIKDEIIELRKNGGIRDIEIQQLKDIYELITGSSFDDSIGSDLAEQDELIEIEKIRDRASIISDLKNTTPQDPELIEVKSTTYKRDNKSVADLKIIRDFKCQICGGYVLMRDGRHYVEAAHITEKSKKGCETPDNILILCPNHHKEFDYGDRKIIDRTTELLSMELNGVKYELKLSLE